MISLMIGLFISMSLLCAALFNTKVPLGYLLNMEGIIIVLGGTVSIFLTANKFNLIRGISTLLIYHLKGKGTKDLAHLKVIIIEQTKAMEEKRPLSLTGNVLLDKGMTWVIAGLGPEAIDQLIEAHVTSTIAKLDESTQALMNLSKYPPALGMIGTVVGIVGIFSSLGNTAATSQIGVNLGVAMTATLYGLVLTNFILSPIGEFLNQATELEVRKLSLAANALKLWSQDHDSFYVKEFMDAYEAA